MIGCEECATERVPGALWPWGTDGHYPPAHPYVERHDLCETFDCDDDAAAAVAAAVGGIVVLCPHPEHNDRWWPAVYPWPQEDDDERTDRHAAARAGA